MDPRRSPLAALKTAFDAVFRRDLALRREGGGVRVVLEARDAAAAKRPPTPAELERQRLEGELADARAELTRWLDAEAGQRAALRELATVEHALGRIGWRAFDRLPLAVLQRAPPQLEDAVTNWSPRGLAGLRSRMAVAAAARARAAAAPAVADRASAGMAGHAGTAANARPRLPTKTPQPTTAASPPPVATGAPPLDDIDRALLAAYGDLAVPTATEPPRR